MTMKRDMHRIWLSDVTLATTVPEGAEGEVPRIECRGLSLKNSSLSSALYQPLSTPPSLSPYGFSPSGNV